MDMAKHTLRDEVWHEIIQYRESDTEFRKQDITSSVDASDRTVHGVVTTATELGLLTREKQRIYLEDPRGHKQWQSVVVFKPSSSRE